MKSSLVLFFFLFLSCKSGTDPLKFIKQKMLFEQAVKELVAMAPKPEGITDRFYSISLFRQEQDASKKRPAIDLLFEKSSIECIQVYKDSCIVFHYPGKQKLLFSESEAVVLIHVTNKYQADSLSQRLWQIVNLKKIDENWYQGLMRYSLAS